MPLHSPLGHMLSRGKRFSSTDLSVEALLSAIIEGDTLLLEQVLPDIDDIDRPIEGWPPLSYACLQANYPVVCRLLLAGADPNGSSSVYQLSPLHVAVSALNYSQAQKIILQLVAAGADLESRQGGRGTPLMEAMSNHGSITKTLLELGANPFTDRLGAQGGTYDGRYSALHIAAENEPYGRFNMRLLVQAGVDVNVRANDGRTPLMLAAFQGFSDNVRFLLDHGADKNLQCDDGRTALDFLLQEQEECIPNAQQLLEGTWKNPYSSADESDD